MDKHTIREQNTYLRALGFRFDETNAKERQRAIRDFQTGYNLGPLLKADGIYGEATTRAMIKVNKANGRASRSFFYREWLCQCGGKYADCPGVKVDRRLLVALEKIRTDLYKGPIRIVSGFRCDRHNKAVGGASKSQHTLGTAADIPARVKVTADWPTAIRGLGFNKSTGMVRHVDTRKTAKRVVWPY